MFVARDSDGLLYLYENRPYRRKDGRVDEWMWRYKEKYMQLDYKLFPDLGWEDEPIEVELVRKEEKETVKDVCELLESELKRWSKGNDSCEAKYRTEMLKELIAKLNEKEEKR